MNSFLSSTTHASALKSENIRGISSREVSKARYLGRVWSYDFIFEQTEDGKTLKFLTIVDEFSRVAQSLSCGRSLTGLGLHFIGTLETLLLVGGNGLPVQ